MTPCWVCFFHSKNSSWALGVGRVQRRLQHALPSARSFCEKGKPKCIYVLRAGAVRWHLPQLASSRRKVEQLLWYRFIRKLHEETRMQILRSCGRAEERNDNWTHQNLHEGYQLWGEVSWILILFFVSLREVWSRGYQSISYVKRVEPS